MGYERYPRDDNGRSGFEDYGRERGYSSARDYQAAGLYDRDGRQGEGARDYDRERYGPRHSYQGSQRPGDRYGNDRYGSDRYQGGRDDRYDRDRPTANRYVERERYGADAGRDRGETREYHGSYGAGGRPFEDYGPYRHADDDRYRGNRQRQQQPGRPPQGYDYDDRGFFARAGDEVRSWFGDEEAERRREFDSRLDERAYNDRDHDYHSWRHTQIQSLDRDYDEYRRENRTKFEREFAAWRSTRQTQRDALNTVEEHMDVVGSDGEHVGTVDKVRGDRILLTKTDADAGGRHHSIPSSWLHTVDTKVTLSKTAAEAKATWRDEERNQALFGDDDRASATGQTGQSGQSNTTGAASSASSSASADGTTLNRSFSGTY